MKSILCFLLVVVAFSDFTHAVQEESNYDAEERHLNNYNQYRKWMQYYANNNAGNGGGYYRNGGGYYGGWYYKMKNQKKQYYGDDQADDQAADDQANAEEIDDQANNEDGEENYYADDGSNNGATSFIPSEIEEEFWRWYESPPSQWTGAEWAWFSGILVVTVGFMFCCCLGCANLCMEGQERACNHEKQDNFDDYTSLESGKRGSFTTLHTKDSASTTGETIQDDATYDSILRMRSS